MNAGDKTWRLALFLRTMGRSNPPRRTAKCSAAVNSASSRHITETGRTCHQPPIQRDVIVVGAGLAAHSVVAKCRQGNEEE